MRERPWLRRLGMLLCVVMAVIIVCVFDRVRKANEAERAELRRIAQEFETTMRPLWNEKARLEQEIAEQEKVVAAEAPPSPVILLCTEPNARLLSDVCPITEQYGYTAAVVISENAFPGDADCLTEGDIAALSAQGWELCLGADAGTDLAALYRRVREAGLPTPTAVYFPAGDGTAEQETQAQELGIRAVIRYGKKTVENNTEGLWYLSAYGSNEADSKTVFQSMAGSASPLVLTVGYSNKRELFSSENYGNMLKTISSYEKTNDVEVVSLQSACGAYPGGQSGGFDEPETEAQRRLRELREELDAVSERIWDTERYERNEYEDQ